MPDFNTPMMKQYLELKKQYQDCLLFFRLGDFYELFMEDAQIGAKVLNITLTSRPRGKDGRIPMAGVPYHAVDTYLNKLVKSGYKVAICEQVSLPNKYGLVDREIVRVVTPGTILDENALNKKENNFIVSLFFEGSNFSLSAADISTGFFTTLEKPFDDLEQTIKDELAKFHPVECILPESLYNDPEVLKILKSEKELNIYPFLEWDEYTSCGKAFLKEHFSVSTLASFSLEDQNLGVQTAAALLGYLKQTQKSSVGHIKKIIPLTTNEHLGLDKSTIINLEIFSTIREHDNKGTLLNVLDQTTTAMGGRLLKDWLSKPLIKKEQIEKRLDAVEEFVMNSSQKEKLTEQLKQVPDIERLLSRLTVGLGNARDLVNLKISLKNILEVKNNLLGCHSDLLKKSFKNISKDLEKVIKIIEENILDEPPIDLKIGGLIKPGVLEKLDSLREKVDFSKDWIQELERKEREKTGISSLKVRFNKVFGFYIEISKANLNSVPKDYLRKQTLVNGERFITPELKKHEEIILTAQESIVDLEYQFYLEKLNQILKHTAIIQEAASAIALIDCLLNFSFIAEKNNYSRPKFIYSGEIKIKAGRHPVVEKLLENEQFVPNNLSMDKKGGQLHLITGPNMAGKSVYIRQIALIVLMAQIGSFVPADQALISLVDRIFVRSGASDIITSGLSTFMVEMVETAYILNTTSSKSLIIMDEIGRGTSTYDGISIAWAIAEYLVTNFKIPPKTLFATHYHELQKLEEKFPKSIKNYSMAVTEEGGNPIFLHTVVPGGASSSFGIAVAKLAGIPYSVIKKAQEKLDSLDNTSSLPDQEIVKHSPTHHSESEQTILEHLLVKELEALDISNITPLEALNKLADIKAKLKILQNQNVTLLDVN